MTIEQVPVQVPVRCSLGAGGLLWTALAARRFTVPVVEAQAPAPSFADDGVSGARESRLPRVPHRRRRRVGHAAAFPARGGERRRDRRVRSHARRARDRDDPSSSLLLNKPTNRVRHVGGVKIEPGSADEQVRPHLGAASCHRSDAAVSAARARLAVVKPAVAHQVGLRRLTHSQYNNTVRDLLGDYSRPADRFPPEDFVGGFKNQTRTQGIPPVLEDAYSARGRADCAERVPRGRCQRPRSRASPAVRQARASERREMPRSVRARVRREGVPPAADRASKCAATTICSPSRRAEPASSSKARASSSRRCCSRRSSCFTSRRARSGGSA